MLRALEDLACKEREMFELDNRKDQVMTICKVALVNVVMWTRDHYFPLTYAHATWKRLAPFFHLPGRVTQGPRAISVELRPFNDRQLNHDLVALCERVNQASPSCQMGGNSSSRYLPCLIDNNVDQTARQAVRRRARQGFSEVLHSCYHLHIG